jgi:hypothetical protein
MSRHPTTISVQHASHHRFALRERMSKRGTAGRRIVFYVAPEAKKTQTWKEH